MYRRIYRLRIPREALSWSFSSPPPSTFTLKKTDFFFVFPFWNKGIDDLRIAIYDVARNLQKSERGQVSVMGEKIPHSFLLVADVIEAKRQELRDNGRLPIMHKSEYEALVLDTIKNDTLDIEDTNDLVEVTKFMHERGEFELSDWLIVKCAITNQSQARPKQVVIG